MPAAAFFDLDKTLWPCSSEKAFAGQLFARGGISIKQLVKIIFLQIQYDLHLISSFETVKKKVLCELFSGELVAPCLEVYEHLFHKKLSSAFFPEMLNHIHRHREAGDKIVIISATIDFMASPAADFLQADECFATTLHTQQGLFSGEVLGSIPYGKAKADIVRDYARHNGIELGQCHAYGDHWEDRHMLEVVGNPVAINPDYKLMQHAKQRDWKIQIFRHEVKK